MGSTSDPVTGPKPTSVKAATAKRTCEENETLDGPDYPPPLIPNVEVATPFVPVTVVCNSPVQ
jgi:hypothetical protein